jgi:ubiquinone/menaquinone biosynthesis C-methylase UbiE
MATNLAVAKPDYGFDGSPIRMPLLALGAWAAAILLMSASILALRIAGGVVVVIATLLTMLAAKFVFYVRHGKLRLRDHLLSMIAWRGDETVLDIGTGRGLLMIGAAKKLTTGRSVGTDIWRQFDMADNHIEATLRNAELEGVAAKVEVKNEDARHMLFANRSFDVILSNLCLHNIPSKEGRAEACREIVRVLKPGGVVVISDPAHIGEYAEVFRSAGLSVKISRNRFLDTVTPWHRNLKASRTSASGEA